MYSNYFLINKEFLDKFGTSERAELSKFAYDFYRRCGSPKSKRLSIDEYFASPRRRYSVVYSYCPKCKKDGFSAVLGDAHANGLKYCPNCGEPSISHRFNTGIDKIIGMLRISHIIEKEHGGLTKYQNQQIVVLICSVLEVYLREFYADILNAKFVMPNESLYGKFLNDCKNDFLNPGKAQERLKRELGIDFKDTISPDAFKWLDVISDSRNVIVHNNGICDMRFVKKHPEIELRAELSPKFETVVSYLKALKYVTVKLDDVYQKAILDSVIVHLSLRANVHQLSRYVST